MPFNPAEERLIIAGYQDELDVVVSVAESRLQERVATMVRAGVSRAQIERFLIANRENILRGIANEMASKVREQLSRMSFASFWNEAKEDSGWWKWVFEPTAKHCGTCIYRNNRVGTTAMMEEVGVPRTGTTECSVGCRCDLQPIDENEYLSGKARGLLITKNGGHPPGAGTQSRKSRRAVSRKR